jgi:hypothetical protein
LIVPFILEALRDPNSSPRVTKTPRPALAGDD